MRSNPNGVTFIIPPTGRFGGGADFDIEGYTRSSSLQINNPSPISIPINGGYSYIRMSNAISTGLEPDGRTDAFSGIGTNTGSLGRGWNTLYEENTDPTPHLIDVTSFSFANQSVAVTSTPGTPTSGRGVNLIAVPEPATWAVMLVGFFGLGAALRRGRRAPAGA